MAPIVDKNCNITKPVIEYINEMYAVSENSIYKIQYMLKKILQRGYLTSKYGILHNI